MIESEEIMICLNQISGKLSGIDGKISEMDGRISELGGKISEMGGKISEMDGKISELGGKISEMDGKIFKLDEKIDNRYNVLDEKIESYHNALEYEINKVYEIALKNKENIENLLLPFNDRNLYVNEEVAKIPEINRRLNNVENVVGTHSEAIRKIQSASA